MSSDLFIYLYQDWSNSWHRRREEPSTGKQIIETSRRVDRTSQKERGGMHSYRKGGWGGIHNIFLIFSTNTYVVVLIRSASPRRF